MPYFKDADEVYEYIGKLFEDLAEDEELAPKFRKANTIVQYQYRNPESQITVKMIEGEDGQVDCGETAMEPEVVMTMEADTAHKFWLGNVNVTVALARGQMKAKGPVAKILKLVPLVKPVFPRYRKMLEDAGRKDLLEARSDVRSWRRARVGVFGARQMAGFKDFYQYVWQTRVIAGRGLIESAGFEFMKEGAQRVFIVTDEVIRGTGLIDRVEAGVEDGGLEVAGMFDDVPQDSSTTWSRPARRPPRRRAPTRSSPSAAAR